MHDQQMDFCRKVRRLYPEYFAGTRVVDFGSLDINGSNRYLFEDCYYTGVDIGPGRNVDVVCRAHNYRPEKPVDIVISTEMLEHDEFWKDSLLNAYVILRTGGLLLFTCASDPRGEHGTRRSDPASAPHVGDYYRNINPEDMYENFNLDSLFDPWILQKAEMPGDLYFYGVKR